MVAGERALRDARDRRKSSTPDAQWPWRCRKADPRPHEFRFVGLEPVGPARVGEQVARPRVVEGLDPRPRSFGGGTHGVDAGLLAPRVIDRVVLLSRDAGRPPHPEHGGVDRAREEQETPNMALRRDVRDKHGAEGESAYDESVGDPLPPSRAPGQGGWRCRRRRWPVRIVRTFDLRADPPRRRNGRVLRVFRRSRAVPSRRPEPKGTARRVPPLEGYDKPRGDRGSPRRRAQPSVGRCATSLARMASSSTR